MAQFARPDGNITQTNFTGGFAEIDEASYSDSDFAYGANNTAATLEVSLSNVTDPVSSTGHTVRVRIAKTNAGTYPGTGGANVVTTVLLLQGSTTIATVVNAVNAPDAWTETDYTLSAAEANAITDYNDLRIRVSHTASGGSPANRRGSGISWAELEVPDAFTTYTDSATVPLVLTPSSVELAEFTDASTVALTLQASGTESHTTYDTHVPVVTDDFNRADTTGPDLGANWTNVEVGGFATNGMQIVSNHVEPTTLGSDKMEIYTGVVFPANQYAQAKMTATMTSGDSDTGPALYVRATSSGSGYRVTVNSLTSVNNVVLSKFVNGAYTGITGTITPWVSGDVLRVEAQGSTIRVYQNGTQLFTTTDTSIETGAPGIGYSAGLNGSGSIDDFEAGSVPFPTSVYLTITPSGADIYGKEYTDSDTVAVKLTPSSDTELAEYADSAEVYLDLQVTEIPFGVLIDDFTGSDGNIDGRTALNGDTWHQITGDVSIVSNQIGSGYGGANLNGPYGPDVRVWITVVSPPGTVGANYVQLGARDNGTAKYALLLYGYGPTDNLRLALTSPFTWLDWQTVTFTAGDKLCLEVVGNHIRAYHYANGAWNLVSDVTDDTLSAAGKIGFVRDPTGGDPIVLDDFGGGTAIPELAEFVEGVIFPTTGILDTFTGGNESPITTNWTAPLDIAGNPMSRLTGWLTGYGDAYYDVAEFGPDCEMYLDVVSVTSQTGYPFELIANISGEGTSSITSYNGRFTLTATGWTTGIFRMNSGSVTWLSMDNAQSFTVANGDGVGISVINNVIRLYYRSGPNGNPWVLVQEYDDSAAASKITTAGYLGVYNADNDAKYDNFGGGTYVFPGVRLTLTPSGAELAEVVDSAEIYLDLQPSATETYGKEYVDSGTISLDLQASGIDVAEAIEAATVSFNLETSGTEYITHEYIDAGTALVDLQASGVEVAEFIDLAEAYIDIQLDSAELAEYVEAQTTYLTITPSGTDEYTTAGPKQTGVDRVAFTLDTPQTRTDHYFRATCSLANGAHTGVMRFQLYQGASTAIGSVMETTALTGSPTQYEFYIPDADAQDFTDYSDIQVGFYGYSDVGDPAEFRIHEMELQIPAASGAAVRLDSATVYLDLSATSIELAEFTDADTAYVVLSAQSIEEYIVTDAQEVYVDIQASGTEYVEHGTEDIDTAYFDLSITSIEFAEFIDTAIAYVDLQPDSTELREIADSATPYFDLSITSVEFAEFVDSATNYIDLQPSSVEYREILDSAEVYVDLTTTSVELAEYVDTSTVYADLQASGTDEVSGLTEDTAEVYFDIQTTTADVAQYVEIGAAYVDLAPSSTDIAIYTEAATAYLDLQSSGAEIAGYSEAFTVYFDLQSSAVELAQYVEAPSVYFDLQSSGVEFQSATGTDEATVPFDLQTSSVELAEFVDASTAYFDLQISGVEQREITDANSIYVDIEASGTDQYLIEYIDAATAYLDIQVSTVEAADLTDTTVVPFALQGSGSEFAIFTDSQEAYFDLQSSGVEQISYPDTETVYLDLLTFPTELAEFLDLGTIRVSVTILSDEALEFHDAGSVYLDIQPGAIFVEVTCLLEITGCVTRWVFSIPIARWETTGYTVRWDVLSLIARWAILETRRLIWKS